MANIASKATKVAKGEVGYIEKATNKDLENKTKNPGNNNYTKYGKWIGANGDYWCASFLSWIFYMAFGAEIGKKLLCGTFSAACETIRQNFIKAKQYTTSSPREGDVIFFTGSRHSGANHIGYVYKVSSAKVYTIEGNTSNGSSVVDNGGEVCYKEYSLSYSRILGYGRPKYDKSTSSSANTSKKAYSSTLPTLPARGYFKKGDTGLQVKNLQKLLNWIGNYGLSVDGEYGNKTTKAVEKYQKDYGLTVDGEFGEKSLEKAKKIKK